MATFGLGTRRRSSPGSGASTPPLKKYVTWAYFSVSATWNWRQPASLTAWARERAVSGGNATSTGRAASYSVIVTTRRSAGPGRPGGETRSKPPNVGPSASAWVSWRARSARKFAWTIASPVSGPGPSTPSMTVGSDELVGLAARVARPRWRPRAVRGVHPLAVDDRVVGELDPVPALVAVHREVAAADRRDPAPGWTPASRALEVGDERRARTTAACPGRRAGRGSRRAAPARAASAGERHEVPVVGVDAARPDEADDVEAPRPAPPRASAGREERRALGERAVGDRSVDARQVLEHRPAGAEIEVADLGVAHLARGQADGILGRAAARCAASAPAGPARPASGQRRWRHRPGRARSRTRRGRRGRSGRGRPGIAASPAARPSAGARAGRGSHARLAPRSRPSRRA